MADTKSPVTNGLVSARRTMGQMCYNGYGVQLDYKAAFQNQIAVIRAHFVDISRTRWRRCRSRDELRHAVAFQVTRAQCELRIGVVLIGGQTKPADGPA